MLQEEEAEAKAEAEKVRPGLTTPTDGSRLGDGDAGYAVVWKNGQSWVDTETHMGYNQRPTTQSASPSPGRWKRRPTTPERVTIFTDARPAIRRMASEEMYVLQARKRIAVLRRASTQGNLQKREG